MPVPEGPVWAFFRDGDAAALRHNLGQAPKYSYTAELTLHLNHLVARSEAMGDSAQLASLLPRLQAECSVPMPYEDLKAALTRAQDRWEQQVEEQSTLASLGRELAFQGYPDSFDTARKLGRKVTLLPRPAPTAARRMPPSSAWPRPWTAPISRRCACWPWRDATASWAAACPARC